MPTTTTKLFLLPHLRLLHPHFPSSLAIMKPPSTRTLAPLHSTFWRLRALQNAPFRVRAFSSRPRRSATGDKLRPSKSLVDDEAELSDWVDQLRNGDRFADSTRKGTHDTVNSLSRTPRFAESTRRRVTRELDEDVDEDDGFRSSRRNNMGPRGALGKRKGGDLRRGGKIERRRAPLKSEDDEDDVVGGRTLKGGGIGRFISEEEEEEEEEESESESSEDEEILKKSRSALFGGSEKSLNRSSTEPTPTASSPGGSDSYLSETRYIL